MSERWAAAFQDPSPGRIRIQEIVRVQDDGGLVEFRVQLFNAFNHTNFETPDSTFGTSNFGTIFEAKRAREIEIALKYSF